MVPLRPLAALAVVLLLAVALPAAAAEEAVWPIERVSVSSEGAQPLRPSGSPDLSADGRYVAFESDAPNLVPGDTNDSGDVFVRDRVTGTTERVSVASDGTQADSRSTDARIGGDGRFVIFVSAATNLAPGITNTVPDVFVHDRSSGVTERVSVASDGTESDGHSRRPAISADGRYVVFDSRSRLLHPDKAHGGWDVFLHDRETGQTELVSRASDGTPSNSDALMPDISADGRWVVFHSPALALDPTAISEVVDIFLLDLETRELQRISKSPTGQDANWHSGWPRISADGSVVIYRSEATNLVPEVRHIGYDVYAYDRSTGLTERVSVSSTGGEPTRVLADHVVSADGRYVAYQTWGALAPDVTNGVANVYVHDRLTRATERVGLTWSGDEPGSSSMHPALSGDGRAVAFVGYGGDWVPEKTNTAPEVYVHERGPALGVDRVRVEHGDGQVTVTGRVSFEGQMLAEGEPDAEPGALAWQSGVALRRATLVARPHQDDILARLALEHLAGFRIDGFAGAAYCQFISCPNSLGGAPLVLYGLAFTLDGVAYEARAQRPWTEGNPFMTPPRLELYRCEADCEQLAELEGATGTTGEEVLLSLPLGQLGLEPGSVLEDVRAYAALGHIEEGPSQAMSEVALPDVTVPEAQLRFALEGETTVAQLLPLQRFTATLDAAQLQPGPATLRADACVGPVCASSTVAVD